MTPLRFQHVTNRSVMRNRIGRRLDGPEMETAIGIGAKPRTHRQIADLVELLHVVIPVIVGMPDVHNGARKRLSIDGRD